MIAETSIQNTEVIDVASKRYPRPAWLRKMRSLVINLWRARFIVIFTYGILAIVFNLLIDLFIINSFNIIFLFLGLLISSAIFASLIPIALFLKNRAQKDENSEYVIEALEERGRQRKAQEKQKKREHRPSLEDAELHHMLLGHTRSILSIAWSLDGKWLASAIVVFDAHSETDPFAGVQYWSKALAQAQRIQGISAFPLKKFLVQARIDRGGISVSNERIHDLARELGFDEYYETSAKEGWHVVELREAIQTAVDWQTLPKISSTELLWRIKKFLIAEKESGHILTRVNDLYRLFLKLEPALAE